MTLYRGLSDELRAEAMRMIADQIPLPEIRRRTNLCNSTIRWLAYREGMMLVTNSGPTTHVPKWRGGPKCSSDAPVQVLQVNSPNYVAAAAALRW